MPRDHGARAQMGFGFETTYGVPPASGNRRLPFASKTLSGRQPLLDSELLGLGRDPQAPIKDAVTVEGDVVVPVCARSLGYWLKLLMGEPVTTGDDPYTHAFHSGGWTLPSATIEFQNPAVPHFQQISGIRADRLSVTMQRSGLLTANISCIAQRDETFASTQAGSLVDVPLRRFGHFNGSISRNGAPLGNIVQAEFSYSNGLDRVETIRADGAIDGVDPGMAAMTGRIDARFSDTVLIEQARDGLPCELSFGWSLGAGVSLTVTAHAVYLPVPSREIPGPQGLLVSFDWQAALDANAGRMATITLVNDVETY